MNAYPRSPLAADTAQVCATKPPQSAFCTQESQSRVANR